jgi:hypothetical protein
MIFPVTAIYVPSFFLVFMKNLICPGGPNIYRGMKFLGMAQRTSLPFILYQKVLPTKRVSQNSYEARDSISLLNLSKLFLGQFVS